MNPSLNHDHNHPRRHLSYATYVNFVQLMRVLAARLSHVIRRVNVFLCTNMGANEAENLGVSGCVLGPAFCCM